MSPRWLHWPAVSAGTDYTDYILSGTSYWIIPDGTTTGVITKTGGDSSASWTQAGKTNVAGSVSTTQTGSVTMDSTYVNCIRGGFNQLSNPYQFCAAWHDGNSSTPPAPQAPGWVIYESEITPGATKANMQIFAPIEVQSGVVGGTTTAAGFGPSWPLAGFDDSLLFFFNSYTPGDVQGWTAWDSLTTP